MGILANIIAAEEDEVESIGESLRPCDEWSGIERRSIDTAKIVTLHCLISGDEFDYAAGLYEPVYVSGEGAVVLQLAEEVAQRLAELDEDALYLVAEELAATEDFEQEPWGVDEVQALIMDLADLARLADSQGQQLFVWMHPLLT